jgi:DNA-binding NarL/FixJ family response regulator
MLLFVIDDHPLMREAIVLLFRRIVPEATVIELDRVSVIPQQVAKYGMPDVFCLDLKLPDTNGVSGVREVRSWYPTTPIIVLSASPAADYEDLSLEAGADLYLEKSSGATAMNQALRTLLLPDSEMPDASQFPEKLSKRQKQLLQLLDRGLSNREIADQLQISEHTVKVHLWRLFRRLDVKSRTQALHWARTQGMLG